MTTAATVRAPQATIANEPTRDVRRQERIVLSPDDERRRFDVVVSVDDALIVVRRQRARRPEDRESTRERAEDVGELTGEFGRRRLRARKTV